MRSKDGEESTAGLGGSVGCGILLSADKLKGRHQGRVVELVPRDSFNVIWGCTNSGLGRLGILEVMRIDGLGFSLCAVPLGIIRSCISKVAWSELQ